MILDPPPSEDSPLPSKDSEAPADSPSSEELRRRGKGVRMIFQEVSRKMLENAVSAQKIIPTPFSLLATPRKNHPDTFDFSAQKIILTTFSLRDTFFAP